MKIARHRRICRVPSVAILAQEKPFQRKHSRKNIPEKHSRKTIFIKNEMQNLFLLLSAFVSSQHVETFLEEEANGRVVLKDSAEGDVFNKLKREFGL